MKKSKTNKVTKSKTIVLKIDKGSNCDAWYFCSDGNVYYDSMWCYQNIRLIEPEDYQLVGQWKKLSFA